VRIGIDVDDVVADLMGAWLARYNVTANTSFTVDDLTQWEIWQDLGCSEHELFAMLTPDLYQSVKPMPGALDAINELRAMGHTILYITSCGTKELYDAKWKWLVEHGFIVGATPTFTVAVGSWTTYRNKQQACEHYKVDLLVDDHVDNVESVSCTAYLMSRPHNRRRITPRKRVKSLQEVVAMVRHRKPDVAQETLSWPACAPAEVAALVEATKPSGSLPSEWQARKDTPVVRGLLDYFPNACAEVARISAAGNKQHFTPGTPLHWDFAKSNDHADSCVRHMMDRGTLDTDGTRHTAKAAWRALAELETELITAGATPGRAVKLPDAQAASK
jgi:5'(3')-deoxyribonucleotidase